MEEREFDPPPGAPWPKHPCTDKVGPVPYGELFDLDELFAASGDDFTIHPCPGL